MTICAPPLALEMPVASARWHTGVLSLPEPTGSMPLPTSISPMRLLFVRSGPLNMTPAIERYAAYLREVGFRGELCGLELDFQPDRLPVRFLDRVDTLSATYRNALQRIWMMARWQLFQMRTLWSLKPDVVQFCDVFSAIPALLVKWTRGSTLVFDVRDPADLTLRHWGRFPSAALGWLESFTAARSDVVVMVSQPLKERLRRAVQAKTVVVLNAPWEDRFEGLRFSTDGKLRVSLAGFISHRRNLAAWCEVSKAHPDVLLDVYGAAYEERTRAIMSSYGIAAPTAVTHREAMVRMAASDIVSIMYDPALEIHRFSAPNKYFDALMLGKPVLCARGMHLAEEVLRAGCGLAAEYGDPDALARVVATLRDPATRARMGEAARRHFVANYLGAPARARAEVYRRAGVLPG